jgi:soluble lytic murein transglycosylase-like protein
LIATLVVAMSLFTAAADREQIPVDVLVAICHYETRGEADRARAKSKKGALGFCQVMPETAEWLGMEGPAERLYDVETNVAYAAKWLRWCQDEGASSIRQYAMCYHEGTFTPTSKTKYAAWIAWLVQDQRMQLAMAPQVVMR